MAARQNLINFLTKHKVEKGSEFTHIGLGKGFGGPYYLNQEDADTLHAMYIQSLNNGDLLHLTEKHRDGKSPIFIDFDFKQLSADRLYDSDQVREVHLAIAQEASHYVQFIPDDLTCYVLEKPSPRPDKNHPYKDGFHLIFPDIVTSPTVQHLRAPAQEAV
jgi:hypothetical protein